MPLQLISAPAAEPITLEDAKKWLRVETQYDDDVISGLIVAVRMYAEERTRRSLVTQTWKLVLDSFPGPSLIGVPYGRAFGVPHHAILLERAPVTAVTSIQYLDMGGNTQTMPSTDYTVDVTSEPARITPVFGKIWPINLPQIGSVSVTFTAGYGGAEAVPAGITTWMKLRLAALYENREEVAVGARLVVAEVPMVDSLLDPYCLRYF